MWREGVTSMNEIFFSYFERDDFSDYLYGVLGRLLTYATAFENDLKKLCLLLNFKYSHEELSDAVIMKIHQSVALKTKTIGTSIKNMGQFLSLEQPLNKKLSDARENRNYIVHVLAVELIGRFLSNQDRDYLFTKIKEILPSITDAHLTIMSYLAIFTNEPIPTNDYFLNYNKIIERWVLEEVNGD